YHTGYDPNLFAMLLCSLLDEAGADILFDVTAAHPVMDGGRITGIVTDSAEGFSFYPARQVIDATGDASVAAKAGMPTADGKNYFSYFPREITLDSCRDAVSSGRIDRAIRTVSGGSANLYGGGHPDDVPFFFGAGDGTRSDYFVRNQKIVSERFASGGDRFSRMLVMAPMTAQFRTIRRMEGDTVLHEEDAYRHFSDALCTVNDFDHADFLYEVPRSAMTRRGFDNLTVCGRAVSADGFAWDIVRVIPPAILTGQSAAVCAAQAIAEDVPVAEADIKKIQSKLESEDVMVSFDDSLVPETWDPAVRRHVDKR
ncbi:MAG: FAD-dependent oxidoreductase, partial [Clostridia bacterium]|nr:FAD-dependent oxidoreductase [Clostridia bacterium]